MTSSFDPSLYNRAPVISVGSGISLCRALVKECAKNAPAGVKKAARKLTAVADAAQQAWAGRMKALGEGPPTDGRDIDQEADASWSALRDRLIAYGTLPAVRHPLAERANTLNTVLFGVDGLEFLKARYPLQFATMDTLLKRIDGEQLQAEIDQLAGPEFLAQIRHVHPRYGAMVHAMMIRDSATGENLVEHRRELERALVSYATKVCATVEDDDPASETMAVAALRPLVVHREQTEAHRATPAPSTPAPAAAAASPLAGTPTVPAHEGAAGAPAVTPEASARKHA